LAAPKGPVIRTHWWAVTQVLRELEHLGLAKAARGAVVLLFSCSSANFPSLRRLAALAVGFFLDPLWRRGPFRDQT
jgi:hypothetical protein